MNNYSTVKFMTEKEKIELLCNPGGLTSERFRTLGIEKPKIGQLGDYLNGRYPSLKAMSSSFDPMLFGKIVREIFKEMACDGVTLAVIDGPKPVINPLRGGISEDRLLTEEYVTKCLEAAQELGISVALNGYGVTQDEIDWIDTVPDERFIYENIYLPFKRLAARFKCAVFMLESEVLDEKYQKINLQHFSYFLEFVYLFHQHCI